MQIHTNWLITSPGRTGGRLIADVLTHFYDLTLGHKLRYIGTGQDHEFNYRAHWQVYHSHDSTILTRFRNFGGRILNTRNMVQSALSYCILPFSKYYHQWRDSGITITPEKHYLDPEVFSRHYNYQVEFYTRTRDFMGPDVIIMPYESIVQDTFYITRALGISDIHLTDIRDTILRRSPIKNDWRPADWIANWQEIEQLTYYLETDPMKILQKGTNHE